MAIQRTSDEIEVLQRGAGYPNFNIGMTQRQLGRQRQRMEHLMELADVRKNDSHLAMLTAGTCTLKPK
jgi:hypothetical protein